MGLVLWFGSPGHGEWVSPVPLTHVGGHLGCWQSRTVLRPLERGSGRPRGDAARVPGHGSASIRLPVAARGQVCARAQGGREQRLSLLVFPGVA